MMDGILKSCNLQDLVVGNVLRMVHLETKQSGSFSDCVIVRLYCLPDDDQEQVELLRPHFSLVNGQFCQGTEVFTVPAKNLLSSPERFQVVCLASGKPHNVSYEIDE